MGSRATSGLLSAPKDTGAQRRVSREIERTDTDGSSDLVTGERERIDTEVLNIERGVEISLDGVSVERRPESMR